MFIRRISAGLLEQNWYAVVLEIVIVVVGVFFGLQASNWNENRIAKAEARTYYARLIDDLRAEQSVRTARVAYFQKTRRHGKSALNALLAPNAERGATFLIDVYQTTQRWNYFPQRTTYDELSSGSIANAISDTTLRSQLANFYTQLENSKMTQNEETALRTELRRYMPDNVQQLIRRECGDKYTFTDNNILLLSLPDVCNVVFDPSVVTNAIAELSEYTELKRDLAHHLGILDGKLVSNDAYILPAQDLVSQLETMN